MTAFLLGHAAADEPAPSEPAEPSYAGRDADWWVDELGETDPRPNVARTVLSMFGPKAVPALGRGLSKGLRVRDESVELLQRTSGDLRSIATELATLLDASQPAIRVAGLRLLRRTGAAAAVGVPHAVELLRDSLPEIRASALELLAAVESPPRSAPPAVAALVTDSQAQIRSAALEFLARAGKGSVEAADILAKASLEAPPDRRLELVRTLAKIDVASPLVVKALRDARLDGNAKVRHEALNGLAAVAARVPEVIDDLIAASADAKDSQVRRAAVYALGRVGRPSEAVVAALVRSLDDEQHDVAAMAVAALQQMDDSAAAAALPAMLRVVARRDDAAHRFTPFPLVERAPSPLVDALDDEDVRVRRLALRTLSQTQAPALAAHAARVADALGRRWFAPGSEETAASKQTAIQFLSRFASDGACRALLVSLVAGDDLAVATSAGGYVGHTPEGQRAVVALLGSHSSTVRNRAVELLVRVNPWTPEVADEILRLLDDPRADVRRDVLRMLRSGGPGPGLVSDPTRTPEQRRTLARVLAEEVVDPDRAARAFAAGSLPVFVEQPDVVVPALTRAIEDPLWEAGELRLVVGSLERFLERAAPHARSDLASKLASDLGAGDPFVATGAAAFLAEVDRVPGTAMRRPEGAAALAERARPWLDHEDPRIRRRAVLILGSLERFARPSLDALIARTEDPDVGVAEGAFHALGVVDPDSARALEAMKRGLATNAPARRQAAVRALPAFGTAGVALLLAVVDDLELRGAAILTLSSLGPKAVEAIPALERIRDEGGPLSSAATAALRSIQGR